MNSLLFLLPFVSASDNVGIGLIDVAQVELTVTQRQNACELVESLVRARSPRLNSVKQTQRRQLAQRRHASRGIMEPEQTGVEYTRLNPSILRLRAYLRFFREVVWRTVVKSKGLIEVKVLRNVQVKEP